MRRVIFIAIVAIALLGLTQASVSTAQAAGPAYHVVRYGENLSQIAWRYGVSAWSIARANGLWNPNVIYAGQLLVIPGSVPCGNCWYPPPVVQPPAWGWGCQYVVRYGDTLYSIAARYRTDAWGIARANGIYNLNWIYAGQWLRIPGC